MADQNTNPISQTGIEPSKAIQPGEEPQSQGGESFKSYMQDGGEKGQMGGVKSGEQSPFDLTGQKGMTTTPPSHDTILGQMSSTSSVLGDLQNQLNTKNLNLKQSQKYILREKLKNANDDIRTAATKAGVDVGAPPLTGTRQSPVTKFLALITDGQNQLSKTQEMIQNMKGSGGSLSPPQLLTIQVKLAKAQQSLEYSSVLLSKAVDAIKTMFNIQL